jgi:hypothetical protein
MKITKPHTGPSLSIILHTWLSLRIILVFTLQVLFFCLLHAADDGVNFPSGQPRNGNFNQPSDGEILDVSPPGFCWWRAGGRGEVFYRVHIYSSGGAEIHTSARLDDPAYVPEVILSPGRYKWIVDAVDEQGKILARRAESTFEISPSALPLPWTDPDELLARVPGSHPRLLFPGERLEEVKENLDKFYSEPYLELKQSADRALDLSPVEKPVFNTLGGGKNYAAKRTAYREEYHAVGNAFIGGVVPMALTYLLSGEEKYGLAAKAHLLHLCDWELDGALSVQDPRFDEVGLRLARAVPQAYDWTCDLFSPEERLRMENWMAALGDSLLVRMQNRDYLNFSGESHDGRVPGYLMEFAIVLAHRPEAKAWMEYGMLAALTVFPHWAGSDGGWAEGVDYALQYNERFITPLHSVYAATGYNLWQKPFFRKFPYFLTWCISPVGEITPFGDSEDQPVSRRAEKLRSLLLYYSHVNNDATLRWWIDYLSAQQADSADDELSAVWELLYPDTLKPVGPSSILPDKAFRGVGWVAFHSDITDPENDLMLLFKSSPFGPASHSHADQNSFAIMKGGKALAIPAGERYPQHGSPFHTRYTRLTEAHNALLFNGKGQLDKDAGANGRIIDFRSLSHIGYTAGDARKAYGPPVSGYIRHAVLIRPSLILIVDEIQAGEPVTVDWLMHGKEKFGLSEEEQQLTSYRMNEKMQVDLLSLEGFDFSQSDEWPVDPKEGYPMVKTESPVNQWHFKGRLRQPVSRTVIAALMRIDGSPAGYQSCTTRKEDGGRVIVSAVLDGGLKTEILLNLATGPEYRGAPLIRITCLQEDGKTEELVIESKLNPN